MGDLVYAGVRWALRRVYAQRAIGSLEVPPVTDWDL